MVNLTFFSAQQTQFKKQRTQRMTKDDSKKHPPPAPTSVDTSTKDLLNAYGNAGRSYFKPYSYLMWKAKEQKKAEQEARKQAKRESRNQQKMESAKRAWAKRNGKKEEFDRK